MTGSGPSVGPPESNRSVPALLSMGEPLVEALDGALAEALAEALAGGVLPGEEFSDAPPGPGLPPEPPHAETVTV